MQCILLYTGLLNDGSAMVFFTIFSALFLAEIGIPGLGESIDLAQGFALFFRMSLGGAAIGMAFALALITVLYLFNRRLDSSESVVQVCSTITMAYLCYYTADSPSVERAESLRLSPVVCSHKHLAVQ